MRNLSGVSSPGTTSRAAVAVLAAAALSGAPAAAHAADPAPVPVNPAAKAQLMKTKSFSLAIGAELTSRERARLKRRDLVIVDGEFATKSQIRSLQSKGATVLGYLSVGSVESWRSWYPQLKPYRLGPVPGWPGERFADLTQQGARDALTQGIAPPLLAKGFDGLFLDNLDLVEAVPAQLDATVQTVAELSSMVHSRGGVLMAQNTDSRLARLLPYLDAWNREDPTGTYDFEKKKYVRTDVPGRRLARRTIKQVKAAGLLVTTTDYFASQHAPGARRAVRIACKQGAVPFIGEITLSKVARKPTRC